MQIRQLQDEIRARLGPDAAARLAARRRRPQGGAAASDAAGGASGAMGAGERARVSPTNHGTATSFTAAASKAVAPGGATRRAAVPQAVPLREALPHRSETSAKAPPDTSRLSAAQIAALPPLARTRFATDGLPVEWVSGEELQRGTRAEEVVSRDPLRAEEGVVATGYTIEEAVVLLRCSYTALQRAGASACMGWA